MKKLLGLALTCCLSGLVHGQKDDIVYFEDSDVRKSRMSLALLANPNFTNRNLLNDEIPTGGGLELRDADSKGDFAFNYNLDLFYSLSSALDIGVGFGRSNAFYSIENVSVYSTDTFPINIEDTVNFSADISANMWVLPIKMNFNTSISDLFDLEVIPTVSLIFSDSYTVDLRNDLRQEKVDLSDYLRGLNWRVGISLGGTWYVSEGFGVFVRANANYLLNSMIEIPGYPRETLYSVGADIGVKFHLF